MIEDTIKIHDKYQFEVKLGYPLDKKEKNTSYDIEAFFFLPKNLDINKVTYTQKDFFNDLQSYIRFKTPTMLLQHILNAERSSLKKLRKSIETVTMNPSEKNIKLFEHHIKMFCSIFKSAVRDHMILLTKKDALEDVACLLKNFAELVPKIIKEFRSYRVLLNVPTIRENVFSLYLFADEYVSIIASRNSCKLMDYLKNENLGFLDEEKEILEIVKYETNYRKSCYPNSVAKQDSDNSELLFRQSVLKKFMGSALFLNTRTQKEGAVIQQIFFGIAAGIAMIFATLVAFLSKVKFGELSFSLFMALVVSYIFKDRMKELGRLYFDNILKKYLYDQRVNIRYGTDQVIGICREGFSFVKERLLPKKIKEIRNRDLFSDLENGYMGEKVIVLQKKYKAFF